MRPTPLKGELGEYDVPRHNFAIKPVLLIVMALLAVVVLMIGTAPTVHAATITVDSTATAVANDGVCTLIEAITAANDNAASGDSSGECAAGSGADHHHLTVRGNLHSSGGRSSGGGGIFNDGGTTTITNSTISGNTDLINGGISNGLSNGTITISLRRISGTGIFKRIRWLHRR